MSAPVDSVALRLWLALMDNVARFANGEQDYPNFTARHRRIFDLAVEAGDPVIDRLIQYVTANQHGPEPRV